jgi:uncharacterized protein
VSKIVVFGAGGRGGRRIVAEALLRGHDVTAAVRDPGKAADLAGERVSVVAADVTDAASIAAAAQGHDAAIVSIYRPDVAASELYGQAAEALISGLRTAGVSRLVVLGIGTLLEVAPGVRFMDQQSFPREFMPFNDGRAVELEVLRSKGGDLDWVVVVAPPTPLDNTTARTGNYVVTGSALDPYPGKDGPTFDYPYYDDGPRFTFTDLAVALVDEADNPKHHHELVGVRH